jgi:hypothetical protein
MTTWFIEDTVIYEVEAETEEEAIAKFLSDESPTVVGVTDRFVYQKELPNSDLGKVLQSLVDGDDLSTALAKHEPKEPHA